MARNGSGLNIEHSASKRGDDDEFETVVAIGEVVVVVVAIAVYVSGN